MNWRVALVKGRFSDFSRLLFSLRVGPLGLGGWKGRVRPYLFVLKIVRSAVSSESNEVTGLPSYLAESHEGFRDENV